MTTTIRDGRPSHTHREIAVDLNADPLRLTIDQHCPAAYIGCAGWSFPSACSALFAASGSVLSRYASRFNAVEINSSFYRPHQRKTYQRWADSVPTEFRFSVKVPKLVTHEQRLQGSGAALDRFVDEVAGLGSKLAGALVQLPPSLAFDARVANRFFAMLRRRFSPSIACEPRHPSWFAAATENFWSRYCIARVGADPALCPDAAQPGGAAVWRYWRWHGSPRMYYSEYSDLALTQLAAGARAAAAAGATAWIIFDNTALGHATANAACLQSLLARDG
jgi:uncharacterized protein YecE (DUF72 family)